MIIENRKTLTQAVKNYKEEYIGMTDSDAGETHFVKHGKFLICGSAFNTGLAVDLGWLCDDYLSMDEHLTDFITYMEERGQE